jgi:hypothetical protein
MKRLRAYLSYANVVATLCLVLLVGGGSAFAATQMAAEEQRRRQADPEGRGDAGQPEPRR